MEYYQVFLKVICKEIKRFNLNTEVYSTFVDQLTASLEGNFDVSYHRCAYMFKYAPSWIYFFKDCVNLFLLDSKDAKDMLAEWKNYSEVNVCSLSVGPGLDYLAFILAILEYDPLPPNFTGATVVSKYGAWRNTLNFLLEVFHEQGSVFEVAQSRLNFHNMKVIQADLKCFTEKGTIASLSDAHVVLMMKTLNLLAAGTPQEGPTLNMLKGLISCLKSGAVIFCIDTKPSLALLSQALSNFPGKFLYGPTYRTIKYPVEFPEVEACHPATSSRGAFFVWQKLPSFPSMTNLSTSLEMIPVSTEYKSKLIVPCDSDTSSLSTSIKDETNEYQDSDNVSLMELTKFWHSSSPEIKNILKKLMLSDVTSQDQIGDTDLQAEKMYLKKNEHLNVNQTQLLGAAKALSSVCGESTHATANNLFQIYSIGCSSFETENSPSPTETLSSTTDNLIYEKNTSYNEIEKKDSVLDIKKLNSFDVPVRTKINSGDAILRDNAKISPDEDTVKTAYNAHASNCTSSKMLTEQVNQVLNESFVSAKNNSMKPEVDLEKGANEKDVAVISSQEKVIQTNSHECTNSTSIKKLVDRISHLASSLESMTRQNDQPDYKVCDESPNNTYNQHNFAPNNTIENCNVPSCSKHSPNCEPTVINNLPPYKCAVEEKAFQCFHCNNRYPCCRNTCNIMQLPCCSSNCHFQPCHSQHVPLCNFSCNKMLCEEHFNNPTSPSIVIPLQSISEEALLEIVSLLKSKNQSN